MVYKKPCRKCDQYFEPTSKAVTLCDTCWSKSRKDKKIKKKKSAKKIGEGK